MTQFRGKATEYLPFGSVKLFAPPKAEDCGTNQTFCQPTEQGDNITFQFLAAETVNLVSDGTFPIGSHDSVCGVQNWCGIGWGLVNNTAAHTVGFQTNHLVQDSIFTTNNFFRINFTITSMTAGIIAVRNSGFGSNLITITTNGTYTFYYIAGGNGGIAFVPTNTFDGAVSNVEVVQVATATDYTIEIFNTETAVTIDTVPPAAITGSTSNNVITVDFNWSDDLTVSNGCREIRIFLQGGTAGDAGNLFEDTFETNQGWDVFGDVSVAGFAGQFIEFGFVSAFVNAVAIFVLEVGTEYTITYDVLNYVSGTVRVRAGGTQGTIRSANGTFTETLICTVNTSLNFIFNDVAGAGVLAVDNVIISKANNLDGKSECFDLQTSHDCSFLWAWSNDNRWGNYDYSVISDGAIASFQHKLRLICKFRGVKYPTERNIGEDSAGVKSVDYFSLKRTKLLDIYFAPDYIHDAIAAFWAHDTRTINGTSYIMDDEYEPSSPNDSKNLFKDLMNATIEIQETTQSNLINR
ncbi:MAG: hypothetical protein ACUZ8H_15720, partial [Candidatus Anammoxibacter sp.]